MSAARELTSFWELSAAASAALQAGEDTSGHVRALSELARSCQMDGLRDTICLYLSRVHGEYVYPYEQPAAAEVAATA